MRNKLKERLKKKQNIQQIVDEEFGILENDINTIILELEKEKNKSYTNDLDKIKIVGIIDGLKLMLKKIS